MLLACYGVFGHIFGYKRLLLVKTIEIITSQVYLHKLVIADIKFLMSLQQQCLRYKELAIVGAMVNDDVSSRILRALVKDLDIVVAR